ncbi:type II membrane protein [Recurvomyces mirabilis]|nr:type II membrane protein [Recurvomyces mirabilis]
MPQLLHTLTTLLLLPASITAVTLDCDHIRVDKKSFDLSALAGPKTVHFQQYLPPTISNTTYTIDLCKPLKRNTSIPKAEQCPSGTRICAVDEHFNTIEHTRQIDEVRTIAGEFSTSHGKAMDPRVTRLKESSNKDEEGLRIELNGGRYPDARGGQEQRAVLELICDVERTGNEGFEEVDERSRAVDLAAYGAMARRADDDDEDDGDDEAPELPDLDKDKSLKFISYKTESDVGVLRLTWKTKYACENAKDLPSTPDEDKKKKESSSNSWGFFTWFIIVLFLLIATYIIFGSWLNYNRYGARGWDLLPHGDAIRDLPYVIKEWVGGLVERVKGGGVGGGGSRGGYSAV